MNKHTYGVLAAVVASVLLSGACAARADDAPPTEDKTKWHGDVALGLSVTQGNSKTLTTHGSATATRLLPTDEFRLGVDGTYGLDQFGTTNETRNAENVHGFADYKHLFTERLYGDLRLDAFHDDVADLQFRINVGPAVGYYFIKDDATRLSAEIGPGYEIQRQNEQETQFFTLRMGERFEHSFNKAWKVWEEITFFPRIDDFSQYLIVGEAGTEAVLNSRLNLRIVFQDRYNSRPASGSVPNDLAIISSLVWKYGG